MAGASFTVTGGSDIERGFNDLLRKMNDTTPAMKNIGEGLEASTKGRFSDEVAPDGKRWKPNKPSTKAKKKSNKILQEFGERGGLLGTISYKASRLEVALGSPKDYVAIHQFGGMAGRNRSVEIEARPIFGLSDDDKEEIMEVLEDHLLGF